MFVTAINTYMTWPEFDLQAIYAQVQSKLDLVAGLQIYSI
jgi:hypothetical protein